MQQQPLTAASIINAIATGSVVFSDAERAAATRLLLRPQSTPASAATPFAPALFKAGDRVEFTHNGALLLGVVQKVNDKTLGVLTDDGRDWRVPPRLLRKASDNAPPPPADPRGRSEFRIGDPVRFTGRGGREFTGTVTRINQKTISVSTTVGEWRVSPQALRKADQA